MLIKRVGRRLKQFAKSRWSRRIGLIGLGAFVGLNLILAIYYHNRLYPNTYVDRLNLGNKTYDQVKQQALVSPIFTVSTDYKQENFKASDIGAQIDWPATKASLGKKRPLLPVFGLFGHREYRAVVNYNQPAVTKVSLKIVKDFQRSPVDSSIDQSATGPKLVSGHNGFTIDLAKLKNTIQTTANYGYVIVPGTVSKPKVVDSDLQPLVNQLKANQAISLSYSYNGKTTTATSSDIIDWYVITGTKMSLSNTKVSSYISKVGSNYGIRVKNLSQLTTDTVDALSKKTKLSATLVAAPKEVKHYTFCVRAKNVDESELTGFAAKLLSTLNDERGWSLGGQVTFSQVDSGCNMYAWLSAASQVPSFGAICDSTWSCTVKPSVIINYDRWRYASDAWNKSGGSLDDYRSMVINHESGHWLGFAHRYCAGPGQLAPVMQQQSISLQGCVFNPWPTTAEKNTLKATLGL